MPVNAGVSFFHRYCRRCRAETTIPLRKEPLRTHRNAISPLMLCLIEMLIYNFDKAGCFVLVRGNNGADAEADGE
jgi:hypothetical protein